MFRTFELPWYVWMTFGGAIVLFLVKPAVRKESDAFLARLLGMRPKRTSRRDTEDDEDEE